MYVVYFSNDLSIYEMFKKEGHIVMFLHAQMVPALSELLRMLRILLVLVIDY